MALTQEKRLLQLSTPLGEDKLLLVSFSGTESLSSLFNFQLELVSEELDITPSDIVGKNVTFGIYRDSDELRYFNGCVRAFVAGDQDTSTDGKLRSYSAEVVPWLWFLTQTSDCRIFQEMTVPEIVEKIFGDLGFSDYSLGRLSGSYRKREYCVQYRETDFNFVSRLLEEEGIFYYFKHENGKHIMELGDSASAYELCDEANVDYPRDKGGKAKEDHITSWEHRFEFHTGKWAQTEYDFENPSTDLMTKTDTKPAANPIQGVDSYENYDYPGIYVKKNDGQNLTDARMGEEEAPRDIVHASSLCRTFTPGGKFKVNEHRCDSEQGKKVVITSIRHQAAETKGYETGRGAELDYANTFTCVPDDCTYRPPRVTPKPFVQGIQTAVVVGQRGEEIYCDKYGRVKVQFHWDREGEYDENSSCWIRSANNIAGKKWGFVAIPRMGQEVIVEFLEGDPDRPLITGGVYNAEQMPHYSLPDHKNKTYIKSNSTKGGDGYNELMFDDTADDERLFLHAQKNMDTRVLNDSKNRTFGNRHQVIGWEKDGQKGGDQNERVYQDKHLNVKRHQVEHVEGNVEMMVGNGEADEGGQLDVVIEKKELRDIGDGGQHIKIAGSQNNEIGGNQSTDVSNAIHTKAGMQIQQEAGQEIHIKAGMKVIIEAGAQLSLVGPGGFVDIGPAGVTVQGIMVKINSGGAAGSGGSCSPEAPEAAKEAAPNDPAIAFDSKTGQKSVKD